MSVRILPSEGPEPGVHATKLGGVFLWPKDEPWPTCTTPEVALIDDYVWGSGLGQFDPTLGHDLRNIWPPGHPKHNDVYVGILQLRATDLPELRFPPGKDMCQLLWCPRDHAQYNSPVCRVFWRVEGEITDYLGRSPSAKFPEFDLTPEPSCVHLERVLECPYYFDLTSDEQELLSEAEADYYWHDLGPHEGIKVGGHVRWIQYPEVPTCACGEKMEHLLTVGSDVFEPYPVHKAPGLVIGDCGSVYVFTCRGCDGWPIETVFQCT